MKKTLSVFLALVIMLSMFTPVSADTETELTEEEKKKIVEEQIPELPEGYDQAVIDDINNNPISNGLEVINESSISTLNYDVTTTSTSELPVDFKVEPVNEPFNIQNNDNESVSLATGALNYNINLLHLPGRNGLDLDINIRYNSNEAVITSNEYDYYAVNKTSNFNKFAIGWSFGFTAIEKNTNLYGHKKDTNIVFPDGSSYKIIGDSDSLTTDTVLTIKNDGLENYKLEKKINTNQYILTYPNGEKEYFDGTYGNIVKKEDRFGNYITFEYKDDEFFRGSFVDYIFNPSIYSATRHLLTKITDSAGNKVEFTYYSSPGIKESRFDSFRISIGEEKYARVNLGIQKTYNGKVDIVKSIEVGELKTQFEYEENIGHICYKTDEIKYVVNNSMIAMTKISYPTGGYTEYSYEKHRSAYETNGYDPDTSWYEVYKVSSRFDSGKDCTAYEYEGDRTGYPYSGLDTDGNIFDENIEYHTIVQHNEEEIVYTFDNQHKLIRENKYDINRAQNIYLNSRGQTKWNVLIYNQIYRVGIINNELYIYTQNYEYYDFFSKEPQFLSSCHIDEEMEIENVKAHNNSIYIFFTKTENSSKKLVVKYYNTITNKWYEGTEYTVPSELVGVDISTLYYDGQIFYTYYYRSNKMYYFICSANGNWSLEICNMNIYNTSIYKHIGNKSGKIYFWANAHVIEYDVAQNTTSGKYFLQLDVAKTVYGGFVLDNKTYIYANDGIYYLDKESGTTQKYQYPFSFNSDDILRKTAYNTVLVFRKTKDSTGQKPIYEFDPAKEQPWSLTSYRMFNNADYNVVMGSNSAYITIGKPLTNSYQSAMLTQYYGGFEVLRLNEGTNSITEYAYNSYKQITEKKYSIWKGATKKDLGAEQYAYIDKKSIIVSATDVLGNVTQYDYTDSTYFIPNTIKNYAGTSNEIMTSNTLSNDKTKILRTEIAYDNNTIITDYTYCDEYIGNVIYESTTELKNNTNRELYRKEYEYDSNGVFRVAIAEKELLFYDMNFVVGSPVSIYNLYTYDIFGNILSTYDGNGNTILYTYDKNNRLTKTTYPDGTYTENRYILSGENRMEVSYNDEYTIINYYDDIGRISKQSEIDNDENETVLYTYEYDKGNLSRKYDGLGNFILYQYDGHNRLNDMIYCDVDENYLKRQWINYNDFDLIQTYKGESTAETKRYFDIAGRLIKEEFETEVGTNTTTYEYDYANRLTKTTDAKGNVVENEYNDKGQLLSVTNELGQRTLYEYDSWGNVSKVTYSGGNSISYVYDRLGRLQKSTDALGNTEYYAYDKNNNLIAHKDRKGQVVTMTYDSMNRLVNKNAGTINISYTYNSFGSPLTMTDSTGTTSYAYTYNNRLSQITVPDGKSISYMYDVMGNVTNVNDYQNNNISYTYDGANRIDTILKNGSLMADYSYNANNSIASIAYAEGIVEYTYDEANNIKSVTNRLLYGNTLSDFNYTYDILGNVVKVQSYYPQNKQTLYTYDDLNRLSSVTENDGTVISYTFDAGNNITAKNIAHGSLTDEYSFKQDGVNHTISNITAHNVTYSYNIANQLTTETETVTGTGSTNTGVVEKVNLYTYDANGNRIKRETGGQVDESVVEYTYNELNQLCNYTNPDGLFYTIKYDGTGMRVSKEISNRVWKFYWDRGYVASEELPNGSNATNYIGAQGIFARTYDDEIRYLFKNGHGDVTNTVQYEFGRYSYEYDAYGNQEVLTGTAADPIRYCGEYIDAETGLIYLRNRYYDPSIGRFISEDTYWNPNNMIYGDKEYKAGEIKIPDVSAIMQSSNLYAYCMNNPTKYIDNNGESISAATVFAISAAIIAPAIADGFITSGIYLASGKSFRAGFVNGFVSGLGTGIGGAFGGPIGATLGNIIGNGLGSITEDLIYNKNATIEEIAGSAAKSVAWGIIGKVSASYWDEAIEIADQAGSAAKELMQYDENLGKALKSFFEVIVDVLSAQ